MEFLKWLRININIVSLIVGTGLFVAGYDDAGKMVITHGGQL